MTLTFFYDYHSPYSYLANSQMKNAHLEKLAPTIEYKPINILAVMEKVNSQPTQTCPPKLKYAFSDVARWAKHYTVPLSPNMKLLQAMMAGKYDSGLLSLAALAAQELGVFDEFHNALFQAVWAGDDDLSSEAGQDNFMASNGIEADGLWKLALDSKTAERLSKQNDEAVERGVFGAPTFFVGTEMFFGNDRLDFVKAALRDAKSEDQMLTEGLL